MDDRARSVTFDRACRGEEILNFLFICRNARGNLCCGNVAAYKPPTLCRTLRKGIASRATAMVMVVGALLASPSVEFNVAGSRIRPDVGGKQTVYSDGDGHTAPFMFMEAGPFAGITAGNYPA